MTTPAGNPWMPCSSGALPPVAAGASEGGDVLAGDPVPVRYRRGAERGREVLGHDAPGERERVGVPVGVGDGHRGGARADAGRSSDMVRAADIAMPEGNPVAL